MQWNHCLHLTKFTCMWIILTGIVNGMIGINNILEGKFTFLLTIRLFGENR